MAKLWDDVDLDAGVLRVRRGLHRIDGHLAVFGTKSKRSERTVPLPAYVGRVLREHERRQEEERAALGPTWPHSGYVFTTPIGTPIDPQLHPGRPAGGRAGRPAQDPVA